ncbi:MAG: dephospho-CoA kinase [Pseudomonadota bacterium]
MTTAEQRPYIVGLTGGIGSGKTTVTNMFRSIGIEVIDADEVSRSLLTPGSFAVAELTRHFGNEILNADDSLNRAALRELIFSDRAARHWTDDLLHPLIREAIGSLIRNSSNGWLVLSAPLLLESNAYGFVDRILVVDSPEQLQIERSRLRDATDVAHIERIMAAQLSRTARLATADDIINNDGDLAHLQRQVEKLKSFYEEQANARHQAG